MGARSLSPGRALGWAVLVIYGIFCVFPLLIMLKTALITPKDLYTTLY